MQRLLLCLPRLLSLSWFSVRFSLHYWSINGYENNTWPFKRCCWSCFRLIGPYTVFVPTDAAFAKLGQDVIDGYSNSQLKLILKYHIVDSYLLLPMVSGKKDYTTLLGETVSIEKASGVIYIFFILFSVQGAQHRVDIVKTIQAL